MKRKVGTIFLAALTTIFITSPIIPMALASVSHNGHVPDHLQIISVTMNDYNLKCRAMGGDYIRNITVVVKNTDNYTITDDFSVYLYISQSKYLDQKSITVNLSPGETYPVHYNNEFIFESMGHFTMDTYINDNYATRSYCNFIVTLTGGIFSRCYNWEKYQLVYC